MECVNDQVLLACGKTWPGTYRLRFSIQHQHRHDRKKQAKNYRSEKSVQLDREKITIEAHDQCNKLEEREKSRSSTTGMGNFTCRENTHLIVLGFKPTAVLSTDLREKSADPLKNEKEEEKGRRPPDRCEMYIPHHHEDLLFVLLYRERKEEVIVQKFMTTGYGR